MSFMFAFIFIFSLKIEYFCGHKSSKTSEFACKFHFERKKTMQMDFGFLYLRQIKAYVTIIIILKYKMLILAFGYAMP